MVLTGCTLSSAPNTVSKSACHQSGSADRETVQELAEISGRKSGGVGKPRGDFWFKVAQLSDFKGKDKCACRTRTGALPIPVFVYIRFVPVSESGPARCFVHDGATMTCRRRQLPYSRFAQTACTRLRLGACA